MVRFVHALRGRKKVVIPSSNPERHNMPEQINITVDGLCIDGPCDRNAEPASMSINPSNNMTTAHITRTVVVAGLLPLEKSAIFTQTADMITLRPIFTQNAGTAISGRAPGWLSAFTAGITTTASKTSARTIAAAQIINIRLLDE
jgi:hypothetical protein